MFFRINKKKSPFLATSGLISYVKKISRKDSIFCKPIKDISTNTNIPSKVLTQKLSQIIFRKFDFKKNFFINTNIIFFIIDFTKIFFLTFLGCLSITFPKNKTVIKKYDFLGDKVVSQLSLDWYSALVKNFNSSCLISSFIPAKQINSEDYFVFKKLFILKSDLTNKEKIFFFFLCFKIFYYSIRYGKNYASLYFELIYDIFKSSHIFSNIQAKYYLNYKFYDTSPVFNYFFKKKGGKIVACTQKNICLLSLSGFVFSDVMFTLGKNQGKICNKLGGKIDKFNPVGSLFMEAAWFKKKRDLKKIPTIDILIIGINTLNNNRHHITDSYSKSYYEDYLNWLYKLSKDFPNKKIVLKHHVDYLKDPKEKKILNKLNNIKVEVEHKSKNGTYGYLFKSKKILSFASTMIVEALGHGKEAFYIDPSGKGEQWFKDISFINKYRIKKYSNLIAAIKGKGKAINNSAANHFCVNSIDTSKKISSYFKKN